MLVDADEYLKHLSRNIHLNPVRAKMVESASDYPWSSHLFLIGHSGKELGEYFGGISGAAITMRHKAVADQMKTDRKLKALMKRLEKQIYLAGR